MIDENEHSLIERLNGDDFSDASLIDDKKQDIDEGELERARQTLEAAMAGDGARQMLLDSGIYLGEVANDVLDYTSDDWLADSPNRIEAGNGETVRDDLVFQSPDWERATGRRDDAGGADLIG